MRSLSEARVAAKLDALGVEWRYEPAVIRLKPWVLYLPDFHLPALRMWIEVKGPEPTKWERWKCRKLAEVVDEDVFLVWEDGTECLWYRGGGGEGVIIDGL